MLAAFNLSILFRVITFLTLSTMLVACSGDDSASEPSTSVVAPPAFIINELVTCGDTTLQPTPQLPWKLSRPSDWVVMGSSSAFGAGASVSAKSWAGQLQAEYLSEGVILHNIAKGGYTTYHALPKECVVASSRPQADLNHNLDKAFEFKPDVVFISFPTNDAVSAFKAMESASNILLLRARLIKQGTAVVVLSAQPRNTNAAAQQVILELDKLLRPVVGACYVDLHALLVASNGGLSATYDAGDGVHLNDAGHQIVKNEIVKVLKSERCLVY